MPRRYPLKPQKCQFVLICRRIFRIYFFCPPPISRRRPVAATCLLSAKRLRYGNADAGQSCLQAVNSHRAQLMRLGCEMLSLCDRREIAWTSADLRLPTPMGFTQYAITHIYATDHERHIE